jgi:uncharacterized protein YdeI (YjbR/CyaY-like superfamily)
VIAMATRDPRIDDYIANAGDFAKPILEHIRATVHAAAPDIEETIKWGMPTFTQNGIVCSMAAFKAHCAMNFWKGKLVVEDAMNREAYGHLGKISNVNDLPPKRVLAGWIKKAVALNHDGVSVPRSAAKKKRPALEMPEEFDTALRRNKKAHAAFEAFSPSHRRDYVEWITEAKRDETRSRRIAQAVEWLAEGKPRNWKYM